MEWNKKRKMAALLNKGQYKEVVDLMKDEQDWDGQAVDMFITGFDISQSHLCGEIKDRLLEYDSGKLDWRSALRLETLKIELSNNSR